MSLTDLGYVIQLGHNGDTCLCPSPICQNFTVVDTSCIHHVNLRFCECHATPGGSYHCIQLLGICWLPATCHCPTSAFTFDVLESFHMLTLQSKMSVYD